VVGFSVLKLRVALNAGKLSSVVTTTDLSSDAQLHRELAVIEGKEQNIPNINKIRKSRLVFQMALLMLSTTSM
jgi:hypothetical protein